MVQFEVQILKILFNGGIRNRMSRRARFWRLNLAAFHQSQSHFFNRPINIYRPPEHRHNHLNAQTFLRRLYSATTNARAAQSQPQLSLDLINIMEQKLSAIEDRHSHLQAILNQVFTSIICSIKFLSEKKRTNFWFAVKDSRTPRRKSILQPTKSLRSSDIPLMWWLS